MSSASIASAIWRTDVSGVPHPGRSIFAFPYLGVAFPILLLSTRTPQFPSALRVGVDGRRTVTCGAASCLASSRGLSASCASHVPFRRAIERRALWLAEDAARELPNLPLEDALQLVPLYAEHESPKYEKAALRWLGA